MKDLALLLFVSTMIYIFGNWEYITISYLAFLIIRSFLFSKTYLHHSSSPFIKSIISECPSIRSGYNPTFWLYDGFFHVLFEATFGNMYSRDFLCPQVKYSRETIHHPDGGVLAIDWAGPKARKSNKILMIGPGITGDSYVQYSREMCHNAVAKGYTVGVLIGRGVSSLPIKTPMLHNACSHNDYGFLIEKARKRYPNAFICAVGISLGSGILLKYVAESGDKCALDAIANIATSFNHNLSARNLDEFWNHFGIPGKSLLSIVQTAMLQVEHHLLEWPEVLQEREVFLHHGKEAKSFYDYDDKITARLSGFSNAEEYYLTGSTHRDINKVDIPLFAMNSVDDPIITIKGVPIESFKQHDKTLLMVTSNGGHVGWFTGTFRVRRWFPVPCLEFFEAVRMKNQKLPV